MQKTTDNTKRQVAKSSRPREKEENGIEEGVGYVATGGYGPEKILGVGDRTIRRPVNEECRVKKTGQKSESEGQGELGYVKKKWEDEGTKKKHLRGKPNPPSIRKLNRQGEIWQVLTPSKRQRKDRLPGPRVVEGTESKKGGRHSGRYISVWTFSKETERKQRAPPPTEKRGGEQGGTEEKTGPGGRKKRGSGRDPE